MIDADAQNLDIDPFKPRQVCLVRRDLARSYRSPGLGEENQHHGPAAQAAEGDVLIQMARKGKIRRFVSNG